MRPGDILGIRGTGWLSDHIVAASAPGPLSHVGICTADSPFWQITEALARVQTRPYETSVANAQGVWWLEWVNITDAQRWEMVQTALSYTAKDYGYIDILFQGADSLAGTRWFTQHFAERSLPICSMLDDICATSAGLSLGIQPNSCTPNDIWRFANRNPAIFTITKLK